MADTEKPASGLAAEQERRKSAIAAGRRKSSAVNTAIPAEVLEAAELSAADKRLAEMGYVQVGFLR